jgi:hypothetical protein
MHSRALQPNNKLKESFLKKFNLLLVLIFVCGFSVFSSATSVQIISPVSGSTVSSPVTINAQAVPSPNITGWWVYVDNVGVYHAGATTRISPSISMSSGTHNVIVRAWSSNGSFASANLTLRVTTSTPPPTSISVSVSPSSAALHIGASTQFSASVSGTTNTAVTWLVNGTQSGNSTVGTISSSGLYTAPAAVPSGSTVTVTARSVADTTKSASASVSIVANPTPIAITTSTLPGATANSAYKATLAATGGTAPYTWSLVSGQLPAGLALSSSGVISGTPTTAGTTFFSVQAKDSAATPQAATQAESVVVADGTSATCSGTCYYVSPTGNDSNNGTSPTAPWRTIAKVHSFEPSLRPGDSVLFQRGGVWSEQLSISNVHGTASAPITFGNYGSGNLPVIDGGSTRPYGIVDGYSSGQIASSYITIDGFEIRNTTSGGIIFSYLAQPGITIQNNYVHNNGYGAYAGACAGCFGVDAGSYGYNEGIAFVGYPVASYGAKVLNNIVKVEGGHNAIMVDQDLANPVIKGNHVGPGCSHNCIDFKRSTGMVVKQNIVNCSASVTVNGQTYPGCNGNAFYSEQDAAFMETVTYEQNVAYGAAPGYACFGLQGQSNPAGGISANYYNNSCYAGSTGMHPFVIGNCLGGKLNVQNNILDGGGMNMGTNCLLTWDYNDKYGTSGGGSGSHDMSVNPLFVNPSTMDFHLQSGSPVLNDANSSILNLTFMGACGTSGTCP